MRSMTTGDTKITSRANHGPTESLIKQSKRQPLKHWNRF